MTEAEEIKCQLSILRPRKGDVLVVRFNENMTNAHVEAFKKALSANASEYQGAFVIILQNNPAQDVWVWPESKARNLLKKASA